jgi:2-keto-4-pentenoate hydratase
MRVAELEFAFRLGHDLPARAAPYGVDEVMAAVATLHPAIEIPDTRFEEFTRVGAAQLIADNACTHRFLLGRAAPEGWRGLDLAGHAVQGGVAGTPERHGSGANVLGDPRVALTWLANELAQHGLGLAAGQVVTTGTCVVPVEIAPGDRVWGDFGALGQIEVSLGD